MAKTTKVTTAEDKLRALFDLQIIDSRIDRIRVLRGELPLEVQDAEDQIEGLRTRLDKAQGDVDFVQQSIAAYQNEIKESNALIAKYTEQQNNVRNNREFESLNKEIEYQTLEIELCDKRIRENKAKLEELENKVSDVQGMLKLREEDLEGKRAELQAIVEETQAEEDALSRLSDQLSEGIEPRLGLLRRRSLLDKRRDEFRAPLVRDRPRGRERVRACGGPPDEVLPGERFAVEELHGEPPEHRVRLRGVRLEELANLLLAPQDERLPRAHRSGGGPVIAVRGPRAVSVGLLADGLPPRPTLGNRGDARAQLLGGVPVPGNRRRLRRLRLRLGRASVVRVSPRFGV